jgi:hypothetical protein
MVSWEADAHYDVWNSFHLPYTPDTMVALNRCKKLEYGKPQIQILVKDSSSQ